MKQENIGDIIKRLRVERGFTQKELGEIIHQHRTTIAKWEKNIPKPPLVFLTALFKVLKPSQQDITNILGYEATDPQGIYVIDSYKKAISYLKEYVPNKREAY